MELTRLISGALMPECCTNIFARERWLPDEASGICCAQISQHFASSTHPLGAWVWTESTRVSGSNSTHICLQPGEGRGAGERRRQSHGELWRALSGYVFVQLIGKALSSVHFLLQVWLLPSLWRLRDSTNRQQENWRQVKSRRCLDTWLVEIDIFIFKLATHIELITWLVPVKCYIQTHSSPRQPCDNYDY